MLMNILYANEIHLDVTGNSLGELAGAVGTYDKNRHVSRTDVRVDTLLWNESS